MWIPKTVLAKRFMAYEDINYTFNEGHAVMIQGKNLTDEGQDSNGACKSALLEAVGLLLTGKCIRLDTSAKDLVMNGEKSAELEFTLVNPVMGQEMRIVREVFSNTKSATLEVYINDRPVDDITSVNEGNDRIIEYLGIEKDDLLNFFLISKERYIPFYKLSDTKKKMVIGRFSNADIISPIEEELDGNIMSIQSSIDEVLKAIERHEIKIETFTGDMDSFSVEELIEKRDKKITSLTESITTYTNKIEEEQNKQEDWCKEIDNLELKGQELVMNPPVNNTALDDLEKEEIKLKSKQDEAFEYKNDCLSDIRKDRKKELDDNGKKEDELIEELKSEQEELKGIDKLLSEIDKGLMESIECPKCTHEFSPGDASLNIKKARERRSEVISLKEDVEGVIKEIRAEIRELDTKDHEIKVRYSELEKEEEDGYNKVLQDINNKLSEVRESRRKIKKEIEFHESQIEEVENSQKDIERKVKMSVREVKGYNEEITSLNKEIATIEGQVIKDRKAEFKDQIEVVERHIKNEEVKLLSLEKDMQFAAEEKALFVRFKIHLTNKSLGAIEAHSNKYLETAKSNLRIQLDGYKQNRNGDVKEKISTSILRDGISEGGIGKFSSGEKARIEVANILALKNMINSSSPTGGLDLLILDEVTNSCDSSGIGGIMDMLESTKESVLHITHATFHSMYPYIETVVKEKGISTIIKGQYENISD